MLESLKEQVCKTNLDLVRHGLVVMTWGNVSGIDRAQGLVVIKPSGVAYDTMRTEDMVVVDMDGAVVEGTLKPSSDLPTHLVLYRAWEEVGGIVHTHSMYATMFAQVEHGIRCFGTTHADHFHGDVPCTRELTECDVSEDYEGNTGHVIVERFKMLNPLHTPAVLVANHGPFTWGKDADEAVRNAVALEAVAQMALGSLTLKPALHPIPPYLMEKHFSRKHGPKAYYGQGDGKR